MSDDDKKPHVVSKYVVIGFFILGLSSAIAFRSLIVFQRIKPEWMRPAWYLGVTGYLFFFYYRFRISRKRKQAINDYMLIEKLDSSKPLTKDDREVLGYLLSSIKISPEDRNYALIFILSVLAILIDLGLTII